MGIHHTQQTLGLNASISCIYIWTSQLVEMGL